MEIHYSDNLEDVSWQRICEIFEDVGWERRRPKETQQAFGKSSFVRIAYHKKMIVGFGRTVDDGKYYGLIVDLIVHPDYQGRGIGKRILQELRDEMNGFIFKTLTAAYGKHEFYLQQGWKRQTSAFIWPRNERQADQHTR
jgi:GNAT superfamily N-acetyltransferase